MHKIGKKRDLANPAPPLFKQGVFYPHIMKVKVVKNILTKAGELKPNPFKPNIDKL